MRSNTFQHQRGQFLVQIVIGVSLLALILAGGAYYIFKARTAAATNAEAEGLIEVSAAINQLHLLRHDVYVATKGGAILPTLVANNAIPPQWGVQKNQFWMGSQLNTGWGGPMYITTSTCGPPGFPPSTMCANFELKQFPAAQCADLVTAVQGSFDYIAIANVIVKSDWNGIAFSPKAMAHQCAQVASIKRFAPLLEFMVHG